MKKRILSMLIAIVMVIGLVSVFVVTASAATTTGAAGQCTWTFDDTTGTLTISGNGAVVNDQSWEEHVSSITSIVIEDGVTSIGNNAFRNCSSLESVTISASVATIGNTAFYGCSSLETLNYLGTSAPSIGTNVFMGSGLMVVNVPVDYEGNTFGDRDVVKNIASAEPQPTITEFMIARAGDGEMKDIDGSTVTLYSKQRRIAVVTEPAGLEVVWSYETQGIVEVVEIDGKAYLNPLKNGNTMVTVTLKEYPSVSRSFPLEVEPEFWIEVDSVAYEQRGQMNMGVGETVTPVIKIFPVGATLTDLTWSSNDTEIVTVDENGKITAVSAGQTYIRGTCDIDGRAKSYVLYVTVLSPYTVTADESFMATLDGEYIAVQGRNLVVKLKNICEDTKLTDVASWYVSVGGQIHMEGFTFDSETRTLTIPAELVTGNVVICAQAMVEGNIHIGSDAVLDIPGIYPEDSVMYDVILSMNEQVDNGVWTSKLCYGDSLILEILADCYTREGYTLVGWNTEADGSGDTYAITDFYDIDGDFTLYAIWEPVFTVTLSDRINNGFVTVDKTEAKAGDIVTVTVTPDEGYMLDTLTVTDSEGNSVPLEDNSFAMPEGGVTVSATFKKIEYTTKEDFEAAIADLEDKLADLEAALGDITVTDNLRADLELLKADVAKLDESYATDAELATAIGNVNTTITSLTTRVKNLEDTYATKTEVNTLRQDLNDQYGKLLELINANTLEIGTINTTLGQINSTLTTLATKAEVATEVATLTGLINALAERVAKNEGNIAANASAIETLKTTVGELATELRGADAELTDSIDTLDTALAALEGRMDAAEQNIAKIEQDLVKAVEELDAAMKQGYADISKELANLNTALANAKATLEKTDDENKAELIKKIEEADKALDAAIKEVQKNLDDLKAALEAKDAELAKANADSKSALEAKDAELQTFIIIVCVISAIAFCGSGALFVIYFIDKKKRI